MADSAGIESDQRVGDMDLSGEGYRQVEGGKDWLAILLFVLAALALLAAVFMAVYSFLQQRLPGLQPLISADTSAINWPFNLETTVVVQLGLLLFALIFYLAARHRLINNKALQASSGCPSCQEHDLLRVRRRAKDRLVTLSGIRVARYECRNCTWGGLRVYTRQPHVIPVPYPQDQLSEGPDTASEGASVATPAEAGANGLPPVTPRRPAAMRSRKRQGPVVEESPITTEEVLTEGALATPGVEEAEPLSAPLEAAKEVEDPVVAETELPQETVAGVEPVAVSEDVQPVKPLPPDLSPREESNGARSDRKAADAEVKKQALSVGQKAKITASFGLNLRAEPHDGAELVGLLGPDTIVLLISDVQLADGLAWQQVETRTKRGWVLSSFLEAVR